MRTCGDTVVFPGIRGKYRRVVQETAEVETSVSPVTAHGSTATSTPEVGHSTWRRLEPHTALLRGIRRQRRPAASMFWQKTSAVKGIGSILSTCNGSREGAGPEGPLRALAGGAVPLCCALSATHHSAKQANVPANIQHQPRGWWGDAAMCSIHAGLPNFVPNVQQL